MSRQLVVVDCETTGLESTAFILEVAAVNVDTGEELTFVPYVSMRDIGERAHPDALRINRYFERGVRDQMLASDEATILYWEDLSRMLLGNTFAGSNPSFDARLIARTHCREVWHHRLADLSAYAAGRLGLDPTEAEGLAKVCDRLGVVNEGEHTALGDARATAECFRRLREAS